MCFFHFFLSEFSFRLFIFLIFSHLENLHFNKIFYRFNRIFFSYNAFLYMLRGKERIAALSPSHPLGTTLVLLHHAFGFSGLTVIMGRFGFFVLFLRLTFLLLKLALGLAHGPRPGRGTRTKQQKQRQQVGNDADSLLHGILFWMQM